MQTALFRNWTRLAVSISNDINHNTIATFLLNSLTVQIIIIIIIIIIWY